jgi:phosphatidylserine/phosphatidylglycerophosphate/cardiolipin synthase-like enzyme
VVDRRTGGAHMNKLLLIFLVACGGAHVQLVETAPVETFLDVQAIPEAYEVWPEMFKGAHHTIDLAEFYASNSTGPDSRLEPSIAAIEAAVKRGVKVRFLAEQSFVKTYPETLDRLAKAGVQVRHWKLPTGGVLHAKYFVVDNREAFVGSQNFDWRALEHNQELGARITDKGIAMAMTAIFAHDWALAAGEPAPKSNAETGGPVTLVASPKELNPAGVGWDLPELVKLLDGAKERIQVQLLTYVAGDWTELEAPLLAAAKRGVKVQMLLADWSKRDKVLPGLQKLARVANVEIRLITVPQSFKGFIPFARVSHAKLLVIDSGARGWLGTSNWEKDYFYASRNLGLIIENKGLAAQLEDFFFNGWSSKYAEKLDPEKHYEPPKIE